MKSGQLMNIREIFFFKNHAKNESRRLIPYLFLFLKKALNEVNASRQQLRFNILRQPLTWYTLKTNCIKLQTINAEICSILIFWERVWKQVFHHILCMIFQEKFASFYILLDDQISLSDCLYFLRHWNEKHFFIILEGLSVAKTSLRPESLPLRLVIFSYSTVCIPCSKPTNQSTKSNIVSVLAIAYSNFYNFFMSHKSLKFLYTLSNLGERIFFSSCFYNSISKIQLFI